MPVTWGLDATDWTAINAIGTLLLVVATVALAFVAGTQLSAARKEAAAARGEALRSRTIAVCEKYENDPVLDRCCQVLSKAQKSGALYSKPHEYRLEMFAVLNYLEGIVMGFEDGTYSEQVARPYMNEIFTAYVREYVVSGLASRADPGDTTKPYEKLVTICRKWGHDFENVGSPAKVNA